MLGTIRGYFINLRKHKAMKSFLSIAIFVFTLCGNLDAKFQEPDSDTVEIFDEWEGLFRYENYYISNQPELENLEWIAEQGVTKIINLRTVDENKDFSKESFNEKRTVKKLGIEYKSLPISSGSGYTPENLELFMEFVNPGDKVLIHCKSGGRANSFFMAYLVKEEGFSIDKAVDIGKQIKFSFPLEDLLGVEITMELLE